MILDFNIDDFLQEPVVISLLPIVIQGSILPISEPAYTFLQRPSGLESGIYQESDVQLGERMLDKGSNVIGEGAKGCVTTLSWLTHMGRYQSLKRTLKPWMKTSSRTLRIFSHFWGEELGSSLSRLGGGREQCSALWSALARLDPRSSCGTTPQTSIQTPWNKRHQKRDKICPRGPSQSFNHTKYCKAHKYEYTGGTAASRTSWSWQLPHLI